MMVVGSEDHVHVVVVEVEKMMVLVVCVFFHD
jgi:hypothetical protein